MEQQERGGASVDRVADDGQLWRLTHEHSPVGMMLVDLDGRLLAVNRALCSLLGYDAEELTSRRFQDLTHPDDLDVDLTYIRRTVAGEIDSYRRRKRYLRSDGSTVWGDLSVALVRDGEGVPLHFISQVLDVTDLERERQTLHAIFDTVNVGLLHIDAEGRYERMNRRHAETMRLPFPDGHDGAAGQLGHVYRPDGTTLMGREEMPSYRAAQGEEYDDLRYWVGDDPDTRSAFSTSSRNVRDASGQRTGSVLAYQDITDLMRALRVKDEFVASVSHELRTPLTGILGYLELLRDRAEDLPSDVVTQVEVVERNARRLEGLVADLLHVAQAQEDSLQLRRVDADLVGLVCEAVDAARPAAVAADLTLEADTPDRLTALVDPGRMRQVVDNLLSNAIKYSRPGGSVHVRLAPEGDRVELTITDSGIGIEPDDLDRLFTRFFRGSRAQDLHIPGTGLGLTIVRSIVEAHGGEVALTSEVDVGSTVVVRLPYVTAARS